MDNKGFEIKLNNELVCKAGLKNNHHVVSCIIDAIFRKEDKQQELRLNVSGLNSDTLQHNKWLRSQPLNENDIITIKIINDDFDPPNEVGEKRSDEFLLEQKIKTFKKLKEELKDIV
jgi:hypothetical protein